MLFSWQVRVPAAGQQPVVFGAIKRGDTAAGLAAGAPAAMPRFEQLRGVAVCGWKSAMISDSRSVIAVVSCPQCQHPAGHMRCAAGIAAGNIFRQAADAEVLELPEVRPGC